MRLGALICGLCLFGCGAAGGDIALTHASNHVAAAQSYLCTNDHARAYDTNGAVRIYTPAAHPELLIGFPFADQDPIVTSNGWIEIGVVFDCGPSSGFAVTHYPKEDGARLVLRYSTNEHCRSSKTITNYSQTEKE